MIESSKNIFIFGPPRSGKTELMNDIKNHYSNEQFFVFKINCLVFYNINKFKSHLSEILIHKYFEVENKG